MSVSAVRPRGWPRPSGYSDGVAARAGKTVFVSGQVGWNARRRIVSSRFAVQFERALENVVAVVRAAGGGAADVARLTIFVTNRREYLSSRRAVGQAYRRVMGRRYPAMSLVQVAALLEPGAKVEIEATAVVGR